MPARDPILSPRAMLSASIPKSGIHLTASQPNRDYTGLYLPDTSVTYEPDSHDESDSGEPFASSSRSPQAASGYPWLVASYHNSPRRPSLTRRGSSSTMRSESFSDSPEVIRARTAFLADMPFRSRSPSANAPPQSCASSTYGDDPHPPRRSLESDAVDETRSIASGQPSSFKSVDSRRPHILQAPTRLAPLSERDSPTSETPSPTGSLDGHGLPSGISRMFARESSRSPSKPSAISEVQPHQVLPTVVVRRAAEATDTSGSLTPTPEHPQVAQSPPPIVPETAPLLGNASPNYGTAEAPAVSILMDAHGPFSNKTFVGRTWEHTKHSLSSTARTLASRNTYSDLASDVAASIPAVILGLLLNILDGVSYGFIMFPTGAIFTGFGGIGVSMFFVTTIIAQLTYSLGGSMFAGGNGSMMIEVVPFFHILVNGIIDSLGEEDPEAVIATTMVAFAMSSVMTGLTFYILGRYKLGNIIGFFPRHILVGCIGGVGVFLVETGLEVSASLNDDEGFTYTWKTAKLFLGNAHVLSLWLPAFGLAVFLRVITHRFHHQLIFPMYFLSIPIIFYIVKAIIHVDLDTLRTNGWVFDVGSQTTPWWQFYTYYNFRKTSFSALLQTMPTQFALLFFNILHPPLNVPALAVSLNEDDIDTNRELVAHGWSNMLAGLTGTVPNYLVYVNTLMFYRVGGGSRISGLLLAAGTAVLLVVGTGPIGYIPIMLVGALIFVLGIDLIKEAVWDTRHRTSRSEYVTIIAIMVCMSVFDFVIGVIFGIVLACFFFVVQNSRRRSVRALYTGATCMSAVRRPSAHREYLREVGKQTVIVRLQGFLFFGTINYVEDTVRQLLDNASWKDHPIRFLILDLSLVGGLDMSGAEALCRVNRLLVVKGVTMVFSGIGMESSVAKALQAVDLWTDRDVDVEVFADLNDAMEWTENAYLRAWFSSPEVQKIERVEPQKPMALPGRRDRSPISLTASFINSPRRNHIHDAAFRIMPPEQPETVQTQPSEPINTLMKAFSAYEGETNEALFSQLVPYLQQIAVPEGHVLFKQGDQPDALYLIEHGVLRATYRFNAEQANSVEESMVSGTLAGELSALSNMPRNATVVAERQTVLWKLSLESLANMEKEIPDVAKTLVKLILKAAKTDYDVLLASMASRA